MAAEALQVGCLLVRCLRGGIAGGVGERVGGSCRGRGWRICPIGEDWAGTVVEVAVVERIAAAVAVEACQSAAVRSAVVAVVAAFVAGAYQSVVEPFVFARTDSESQPERTYACSAAAVCWLEAYSSVVTAAPVLVAVH